MTYNIFSFFGNFTSFVLPPPPPPQVSREEKFQAICELYKNLIKLEKKREANPFYVDKGPDWLPLHFLDEEEINIKPAEGYYSLFSQGDYNAELSALRQQYETLDADSFITSISDYDQESLDLLSALVDEYETLREKNQIRYNAVLEEVEQQRSYLLQNKKT